MQVFKFGGASVSSIERIYKVSEILRSQKNQKLLVVISAMGKTTNALEKVVDAFYNNNNQEALTLFKHIKNEHLNIARQLIQKDFTSADKQLLDVFTEVEWLLHDQPVRNYDYYYDQIVCSGELISTIIVSAFLNEAGISNKWIDVRDILRTDNTFRDAVIDWPFSLQQVKEHIVPLLEQSHDIVVTQGFIGSTHDNESTTLGREGSDYTAAVFGNMLDAETVSIWKDVEGVMNADPRQFPDAVYLKELNYEEVIEMAYYGAQIIHPKTIKPLQNKNIPLHVKCFLDQNLPGTLIHHQNMAELPSLIVAKNDQALIHLHTLDFSFAGEKPLASLYTILRDTNIQPNLLQTGAIEIYLCIDNKPDKIEKLALSAAELFDVHVEKDLTLLTIRHYDQSLVDKLVKGKSIRLKQQTPDTIQLLIKNDS